MNRVMMQEGYALPFAGGPRKKHRRTAKAKRAAKSFGRRVKACGVKWRKKSAGFRKGHKWTAFLKKCM